MSISRVTGRPASATRRRSSAICSRGSRTSPDGPTSSFASGRTSNSPSRKAADGCATALSASGTIADPPNGGKTEKLLRTRAVTSVDARRVSIQNRSSAMRLLFLLVVLLTLPGFAGDARGQACASRLFVSGYFSTVHVYDACTGAYLRDLDTPTRIRGAQAVRLGPDGLIYVVSELSQQILRYRNDSLAFVDAIVT